MGTTEVLLETELTTKGYANKIVAPKEDWKKRREEQQAERIKAKKAEREALKNKSALEGMTDEEKARSSASAWKWRPHFGSLIATKDRGHCLQQAERTLPSVRAGEKGVGLFVPHDEREDEKFQCGHVGQDQRSAGKAKSAVRVGARVPRAAVEGTHSSKYVRHYYELDRTDLKFGKSRGSLDIFEAGWRGRGIGPLNVHNHVFHPKGRVVIDEGSHVWRPKDALELAMEKAGAVKNY